MLNIKNKIKEILDEFWANGNNIPDDDTVYDPIGKLQDRAINDIISVIIGILPEPIGNPDENDICTYCKEHIDNCHCDERLSWNDCIEEMTNMLKQLKTKD